MTDFAVEALPEAAAAVVEGRPFETLMCVEGRWTGDGRIIMVDGLSWDGLLPMPLTIDHAGVMEVVGRVDEIQRLPGAGLEERFIFGKGEMFGNTELALQVQELIEAQFVRGVSIETDAVKTGGVDPDDPVLNDPEEAGWLEVTESARVRALSVVTTPAFAEAYITFESVNAEALPPAIEGPTPLPADDLPDVPDDGDIVIVAAAGHTITIPRVPPAEWFTEPIDVDIEGALTITDDGRVYGLLAPADTPFIGNPLITAAPMGNVDYGRFLRGEAIVAGGHRVVAGNITMGCGHARERSSEAMMQHHENSCAVVAQVNVGERYAEPRGVWVAGALLASVDADQVQRMMACQLSGEWNPRPQGGYELLNALLVPFPAFAMGRRQPSVFTNDGRLVASAIPVQFAGGSHDACGCGANPVPAIDLVARVDQLTAEVHELRRLTRPQRLASLRERLASNGG